MSKQIEITSHTAFSYNSFCEGIYTFNKTIYCGNNEYINTLISVKAGQIKIYETNMRYSVNEAYSFCRKSCIAHQLNSIKFHKH